MDANAKTVSADAAEDEEAFRQAMADVRQRSASERIALPKRRLSARPRSLEADERAVLEELRSAPLDYATMDCGDTLAYRVPGLQDSVWRRLRRGTYRIGAELDLHGLNRDRAYAQVALFLSECHEHDIRSVRIIHGKGLRSPNTGPVIKALLDGWLRRRKDVLAFCSAAPQDGGTGAAYVLLSRKDKV